MDVSDFSPEVDGPPCDVVRHRRFSSNRLVQSFRISTLLRLPGDVIIFEWKSRSAARFHLRGLSPRHKSAHGIHLSGPRATCRVIAPLLYNKFFLLLLVVEIYYIKIKYEENRRKKINKREDVPQHTIITLITIRSRKYVYPNFFDFLVKMKLQDYSSSTLCWRTTWQESPGRRRRFSSGRDIYTKRLVDARVLILSFRSFLFPAASGLSHRWENLVGNWAQSWNGSHDIAGDADKSFFGCKQWCTHCTNRPGI